MPIHALADLRPTIDPAAWVAPSADVIGDVVLAAGTSVWFGATIRGDYAAIVVGARSNV